ncbi:hypothetical protein RJ639_044871 [Escallonia herrerae]|uniref:R13L1/DRL21-like LRR repeat region domain-containing protein n=1 Tax=Escallonia herrerae TaxID=1293975 RepID=A0AA89B4Y2_9ASTE|nr:hypothetical protein RJ639_044871 [Escallonia herrerae]
MQLLTALEDLTIFNCGELRLSESDMQGLSNLRRLSLESLPKLLEIPQGLQQAAGTLKSLYVGDCVGLAALPGWLGDFTSLQRLTLCDCPNLTSLPESMRCLTALKELHIIKCPELSRRCKLGGEDWPKVAHVSVISHSDATHTSEFSFSGKQILKLSDTDYWSYAFGTRLVNGYPWQRRNFEVLVGNTGTLGYHLRQGPLGYLGQSDRIDESTSDTDTDLEPHGGYVYKVNAAVSEQHFTTKNITSKKTDRVFGLGYKSANLELKYAGYIKHTQANVHRSPLVKGITSESQRYRFTHNSVNYFDKLLKASAYQGKNSQFVAPYCSSKDVEFGPDVVLNQFGPGLSPTGYSQSTSCMACGHCVAFYLASFYSGNGVDIGENKDSELHGEILVKTEIPKYIETREKLKRENQK